MQKEKESVFSMKPSLGSGTSTAVNKAISLVVSTEPTSPRKSLSLSNWPEAETEEVLDSLRLRITHMFKWAAEVAGFEFYSPLDQKALMRRTVVELVMLGFAKGSVGVEGMFVCLYCTV